MRRIKAMRRLVVSAEGSRFRFPALAIAILISTTSAARAGRPDIPASHPFVFGNADVNVVVLPYQYAGSKEALARAGERLSLLVQIECLRSILKYENVGAVQIVAEPGKESEARPDVVMSKLLGERPGAEAQLREGGGIVMLWSRVYLEGDNISLQSYVRFFRRGDTGNTTLAIGEQRLSGRLSTQSFAFPPRRLTLGDLAQIESLYHSARLIRSEPNEDAEPRPLPADARANGYLVVGQVADWMHIQAFDHSWDGWLRTEYALGEVSLQRRLPEIAFVEALVGYLEFRMDRERGRGRKLKSEMATVTSALERYEKLSGGASGVVPVAVAKQIAGMMALLAPDPSADSIQFAQGALSEAAALLPYSADARNLEAMARIRLGLISPLNARATAEGLTGAIGLDPENQGVLANLETYYELLLSGKTLKVAPGDEFVRDEIVDLLKTLKSVKGPSTPPATESSRSPVAASNDVVGDLQREAGDRLAAEGAEYLRSHWVEHHDPCRKVSDAGGYFWTAHYQNDFEVTNCFRKCRGTDETARYFLGLSGDGDCDSWYKDGPGKRQKVCFPRDAEAMYSTHGGIVAIERGAECRE